MTGGKRPMPAGTQKAAESVSAGRTARKAAEGVSTVTSAKTKVPRSKYGASRVEQDGITFSSKAEAKRWKILNVVQGQGLIRNLRRQVAYELRADGGNLVGKYVADHVYDELNDGEWELVVEDVKGMPTPLYEWKRRHMLAEHGIEIREAR